MPKKLLLLLMIASPLYAQNARKDDVAMQIVTQQTSAGTVSFLKPVAGAVITVCSATGTGTPCTPLASPGICSSSTDTVCTQPNPFNADTNGNYGFWVKPGRYQVSITGIGVIGKLITYDLPVGLLDSGAVNIGVIGIGPRFLQFMSSGTFTIPANVTVVKVTVVGAGGAGGGGTNTASTPGGGGGSGGAGIKWLSGLTPGNTLTVTVGVGGAGVSSANGNNGTASSVSSGTQIITTITANPGNGGLGNGGVGYGVQATAGTGGDINLGGSVGFLNLPSAFGNSGTSSAPSILGGGVQGVGSGANGVPGGAPGAGGSGGGSGAGATTGGAGANGIVIFEWVI